MGKPEGVKIVGRHRGRWEGSYMVYIKETRLEGVQRIHLAPAGDKWLDVVNILIQIREYLDYIRKCSYSRTSLLHGVRRVTRAYTILLQNCPIYQRIWPQHPEDF